jgi:hypothetical protein
LPEQRPVIEGKKKRSARPVSSHQRGQSDDAFLDRRACARLGNGRRQRGGSATANNPPVVDDQHPVYVQIIVKACPRAETPLEPTGQGTSHDDDKPMSLEERKSSLVAQGCIDVPIPMEWITGQMTPQACRGHAGYIAAMQFLEQRQDLAGLPAVGGWNCIVTDHQVVGAISQ